MCVVSITNQTMTVNMISDRKPRAFSSDGLEQSAHNRKVVRSNRTRPTALQGETMNHPSKTMRIWHRWPGNIEWNSYLVNIYDGERMLAQYPQYYSRESNRIEREEVD